MRKKHIINSAKCEGCIDCHLERDDRDKLELVHCVKRDRKYIYGQYIEPCEEYIKKEQ
jgi:hypothetical protein